MSECAPVRVLFVCLGNICRSPLAEGVFRAVVKEQGLLDRFKIDSAGTGAWHAGQAPDRRMRQTASRHGVRLEDIRARQFKQADLADYDHIYAMDRHNLNDIVSLDKDDRFTNRVSLFRDWDPNPENREVPDPYYGGQDGFEEVFRIVDRTSRALLNVLARENSLPLSGDLI